ENVTESDLWKALIDDPGAWPVDCIDELPKSMREKLVRGDLRKTAIEEGKRSAPDAKFSIGDVEFVPAFKARRRAVPVDVTLLEKQAMQVRTRIRGYEPSL
ncbi:MAG: hypothetical protein U9N14_01595, partial [Pseudomonadota bacterium]|nr:hypothetical protein [Pseudomonadota bacterium]